MFKSRMILLLLLAGILSIFASILIRKLVSKPAVQVEVPVISKDGKKAIVVAANDIPFLKIIKEEDLREHLMLISDLPNDPQLYFSSTKELVGKVAMSTLRKGALIQQLDAHDHDAGSPLALEVRPEYRAITVRVDDVRGVGGFLLRGNSVDVITSSQSKEGNDQTTKMVAERVRVLAVDQEVTQNAEKPLVVRSVTLEVLPAQAQELTEAQVTGSIQLLLRNPEDLGSARRVTEKRATAERVFRIFKGVDRGPIQTLECAAGESCSGASQ